MVLAISDTNFSAFSLFNSSDDVNVSSINLIESLVFWSYNNFQVFLIIEYSDTLNGVTVDEDESDLGELDSPQLSLTLLFKSSNDGEVKIAFPLPLSILEELAIGWVSSNNSILL